MGARERGRGVVRAGEGESWGVAGAEERGRGVVRAGEGESWGSGGGSGGRELGEWRGQGREVGEL